MAMPSGQLGDRLMTDWAKALLLFPQVQQRPASAEILGHFHTQARFEVDFPLRVIGIGLPFDFDMPLDRRVGQSDQLMILRVPFLLGGAMKDPVVALDGFEVFFFDPSFGLVGMPPFCPSP